MSGAVKAKGKMRVHQWWPFARQHKHCDEIARTSLLQDMEDIEIDMK